MQGKNQQVVLVYPQVFMGDVLRCPYDYGVGVKKKARIKRLRRRPHGGCCLRRRGGVLRTR